MQLNFSPFRMWKPIPAPFRRVLVAKTSHLGDLVISLPMAAALKQRDPHCTVIFLTHPRTADVARHCPDIDEVYTEPASQEELVALLRSLRIDIFIQVNNSRDIANAASRAQIPTRIGSLFRSHNLGTCTHLVANSRPYAGLNKRLLDLEYLLPMGIKVDDLQNVVALYHLMPPQTTALQAQQFAQGRHTIILSPSLVTARSHQWPLSSYSQLIRSLDPARYQWFVCGLASERGHLQALLDEHAQDAHVTDLVGKLSLTDFMAFMRQCDAMIAGSTGPLHLAAAMGIRTLGLFQSRSSDLKRWQPIGRATAIIHSSVRCQGERRDGNAGQSRPCPCIVAIDPMQVGQQVRAWFEPVQA
ncbi:MAG: glycosyltransferase family 9 protein [Massilia sp.]